MSPSLHLRVAGIGVSVMALTLAIAALLTHELIEVGDRREVDRLLLQELEEVQLGLPEQLAVAAGSDGTTSLAEADLAVQRYLALHPGSDRYLTAIQIGSRRLSTRDGPPGLQLAEIQDDLPDDATSSLQTIDSALGPLRVLSVPLDSGRQDVGSVTVIGPLSEGRDQADDALLRIAVAGAAGLTLGGLMLLLAVRRAMEPLAALVAAARSADLADLAARVPEPTRLDEVGSMAHEFNRMLDRISKDERERQQLLAAVSHELRTPLAVARGNLELFESLGPESNTSAAETAAIVRHELDRLGRIVNDLTAITRGDLAGATASDPVFAPDVLTALRHRIEGLHIEEVRLTPAPPVVLQGDEDRLTQALLNLVVNARTHTPPGTPVTVGAHTRTGHVVFTVTDQGPGIDADLLPFVFQPFVTTKPDGAFRTSGLGLSVVKAVVEAQEGTVDIVTGPSGTTISLSFRCPTDASAAEGPTTEM